jgi:hypothetical protein
MNHLLFSSVVCFVSNPPTGQKFTVNAGCIDAPSLTRVGNVATRTKSWRNEAGRYRFAADTSPTNGLFQETS